MSTRIRVRTLGHFAREALTCDDARVIATFERSFYVESRAGLACIGAVGNGPLNARCDAPLVMPAIGDSIIADLAGAADWQPRPAPAWDAVNVSASLGCLRQASRSRLPMEGFGYLLDTTRERPAAAAALARWLSAPEGVPHAAAGLIGLGPGLTPSGDDLIGGALCALRAAGRIATALRLADWALALAREGTSRISRAHLACAAEGECGETIHEAILALLEGGLPDLDRIDAIGHTSGWDALAGAVLALRALQES